VQLDAGSAAHATARRRAVHRTCAPTPPPASAVGGRSRVEPIAPRPTGERAGGSEWAHVSAQIQGCRAVV